MVKTFASLCVVTVLIAAAAAEESWPRDIQEHKLVAAGEHPRLFFRKSDIAELKKRAQTPEGKLIVAALREQLGGGESMPTSYNPSKKGL